MKKPYHVTMPVVTGNIQHCKVPGAIAIIPVFCSFPELKRVNYIRNVGFGELLYWSDPVLDDLNYSKSLIRKSIKKRTSVNNIKHFK